MRLSPSEEWAEAQSESPTHRSVYITVLQLNSPATIEEISDHSCCSIDSTKICVGLLDTAGIIEQVTSEPPKYALADTFLDWREDKRD